MTLDDFLTTLNVLRYKLRLVFVRYGDQLGARGRNAKAGFTAYDWVHAQVADRVTFSNFAAIYHFKS